MHLALTRLQWVLGAALVWILPLSASDAVLEWNRHALEAIKKEQSPLPMATRNLAMLHIAIFDTVNSVDRTRQPFFTQVDFQGPLSIDAAVIAAAHRILTAVYPQQSAIFDHELMLAYSRIPDEAAKKAGIQLGRDVAQQVIDWRADDNSQLVIPHKRPDGIGLWKQPSKASAASTQWPLVNTFVIQDLVRLRPEPPPELTSDAYTHTFHEVKRIGQKLTRERTSDQTASVFFWDGGSSTLAGYWNGVAQQISEQNTLNLSQNAHLFALLNLALADTAILAWDCKYHYCHWRPEEAIRQADQDGNPSTAKSPSWIPLLPTPSHPGYVSAHSAISGAAAQVLTAYFGDGVAFSSNSDGSPAAERRFKSFNLAAEEAGRSRVLGGVSFQVSNEAGAKLGRQIATYVIKNTFMKQ